MQKICFSHPFEKQMGFLSNFSRHGFSIGPYHYKTVEHYFQSQKYIHNTEYMTNIINSEYPSSAETMGRNRNVPTRHDWELVKEDVMRTGLRAKFESHPDAISKLLATGNAYIEASPSDCYWGVDITGNGKNRLGFLLMELRTDLRNNFF